MKISNLYHVSIVDHCGPLRVVADSYPKAYYKAIDLIRTWEGSEKYEIIDISLIGPTLC